MKVIIKISVFILTFLVGCILVTPFEMRVAETSVCPVQPIELEQSETKIEVKISVDDSDKVEINDEPGVFNLKNFWDESDVENFNKNLLETGEVSNSEDIKAKSGET